MRNWSRVWLTHRPHKWRTEYFMLYGLIICDGQICDEKMVKFNKWSTDWSTFNKQTDLLCYGSRIGWTYVWRTDLRRTDMCVGQIYQIHMWWTDRSYVHQTDSSLVWWISYWMNGPILCVTDRSIYIKYKKQFKFICDGQTDHMFTGQTDFLYDGHTDFMFDGQRKLSCDGQTNFMFNGHTDLMYERQADLMWPTDRSRWVTDRPTFCDGFICIYRVRHIFGNKISTLIISCKFYVSTVDIWGFGKINMCST